MSSPNGSDRTKKILAIEQKHRSYKHLLTPHNLFRSGLWREQGTLSVELLFVRRSLSSIFPDGTDLLVPLSDSERHLAEVLLNQPEKMVSTEEALKKMHERAKKKKTPSAAAASSSPLSRSPRRTEKRKDVGPSEGRKEKRLRETIDVDVEPTPVSLPSKVSLWKDPDAFASVFPQLILEADRPVYEKLGEVGVLERTAQLALQV